MKKFYGIVKTEDASFVERGDGNFIYYPNFPKAPGYETITPTDSLGTDKSAVEFELSDDEVIITSSQENGFIGTSLIEHETFASALEELNGFDKPHGIDISTPYVHVEGEQDKPRRFLALALRLRFPNRDGMTYHEA